MGIIGFRHLGLKAAAVVLALLLWMLVSGEQTVERVLRVPLEFSGVPASLELVGEPPEAAEVRVRGSSGTLGRIATGELAAVLDVGAARPGLRLFHLTTADVRAPFGVEVVQVNPATLSLTFEESSMGTVAVAARVDGEPAAGFAIGGVLVEPALVPVTGPAGALANLSEAATEAVSVAGATETVIETVTVGVADPSVRVLDQTVRVTVFITPAPVEWTVTDLAVQVRGAAAAVVSPESVTAYVRGPGDAREAAGGGVHASVDVSGLAPGTHTLTPRVDLPGGISLLRVEPAEVRVTIR